MSKQFTFDLFNMTLKLNGHKVGILVMVLFKVQVLTMKGKQVKHFQMTEGKFVQNQMNTIKMQVLKLSKYAVPQFFSAMSNLKVLL